MCGLSPRNVMGRAAAVITAALLLLLVGSGTAEHANGLRSLLGVRACPACGVHAWLNIDSAPVAVSSALCGDPPATVGLLMPLYYAPARVTPTSWLQVVVSFLCTRASASLACECVRLH